MATSTTSSPAIRRDPSPLEKALEKTDIALIFKISSMLPPMHAFHLQLKHRVSCYDEESLQEAVDAVSSYPYWKTLIVDQFTANVDEIAGDKSYAHAYFSTAHFYGGTPLPFECACPPHEDRALSVWEIETKIRRALSSTTVPEKIIRPLVTRLLRRADSPEHLESPRPPYPLFMTLSLTEIGPSLVRWSIEQDDMLLLRMLLSASATAKELLFATKSATSERDLGEPPLHIACASGNERAAGVLIQAGADVDIQRQRIEVYSPEPDGTAIKLSCHTPLHVACTNGHDRIVTQLLEADAEIDARTWGKGYYPVELASKAGHAGIVEQLLDRRSPYFSRIMDLAARYGHFEVVDLLLKRGIHGDAPLYQALVAGHIDLARHLCKYHPNPNATPRGDHDFDTLTPLHLACKLGNHALVVELLEAEADPNAMAGECAISPLHMLVSSHPKPNREIQSIAIRLMEAGADPHIRDERGPSLQELAITHHWPDGVIPCGRKRHRSTSKRTRVASSSQGKVQRIPAARAASSRSSP